MREELRAQFLPRFVDLARERLTFGRAALSGDPKGLSRLPAELHSLAGEAAMLGLTEVAAVARECESAARECASGRADDAGGDCAAKLDRLTALVEELAAPA
jgi:HPt (histidine-containing phosphotransfer) domain-containing protein